MSSFLPSALALALVLGGCASQTKRGLPKGQIAFRARTLDGQTVSLGSLRGKVVLVTVMATWSDPALIEVTMFKRLVERYPERLEILCLALDDDPKMVQIFQETFSIPYRVATVDDPARFTSERGPFGPITVMPTSVLLNQEGKIAARMDGLWEPAVLQRALKTLLP